MTRIHLLDPQVANQIAAGEVVERPSSVVKELIENSVDAGAREIFVEVTEGGQERLVVRDNGWGMSKDDLVLAVRRHATSKIQWLEDLDFSHTLGFRGEALAAIGSVAHLEIASAEEGQAIGHRLSVEFGRVAPLDPVAMPKGTRVTVSSLFRDVPARKKAMKSVAGELSHLVQVVQHLAVGFPDVQVRLQSGARSLVDTPGSGHRVETLQALLGREMAQGLIPVHYEADGGLLIEGLVLPAHVHRANRAWQGLYVNRRWISNWVLRSAIEEAFKPTLPVRRYPLFWLWLTVDPAEVDPNAHPAKTEVRLARERALAALCYRAVETSLKGGSVSVGWYPDSVPATHAEEQTAWTFGEVGEPSGNVEVLHEEFRHLVPLAQWSAKYIVAQGPEGLYLIDQHAAHERIYFERFKRIGDAVMVSQPLLIPWTQTLPGGSWTVYQQHQETLRGLGFDIESLGGRTLVIRAIPQGFHETDVDLRVFDLVLDSLSDTGPQVADDHPISWLENHRYAMAACKAAIKANRPMSMHEMEGLIKEMAGTDDPRGCPHGRPTLLRFSLEEVDRRFGRRG